MFCTSQALVQDLFEGKERDQLRILMVTASGIFISVSPLAGTLLQQALDWPGKFLSSLSRCRRGVPQGLLLP